MTPPGEPPRLSRVSTQAFLVAPIRLVLGLAALAAALLLGLDRGPALLAFAFGAVVLFISALADPRRHFLAPDRELLPVPPGALLASKLELARAAVFPSTVGVSALAAIALAFDRTLGAVLAGALAGMGLAALVGGVRVADLERRDRVRLYVERGGEKRLFAEERADER